MRLLLALLGAQLAGILAADAGLAPTPIARRVALVAAGVALLSRAPRVARAAACVALGAASGLGLAARLEEAARAPAAPFEATVEGTVAAVRRLPGFAELELAGVRGVGAAAPPRLRLHAGRQDEAAAAALERAQPGDRLRARLRIRPLEARANPGSPDRRREAARRGVGAVASLVHPDLLVRRPDAESWLRPLAPLHRLRARAARRLLQEGEGGALVAALGVGERAGLSRASRDAFRRLGVSHLLAVSGLHLALAGGLAFRLAVLALARIGPAALRVDPRGPALAFAFAAAVGYALLAGFGVPVRRALVLLAGLALSLGARRPAPRGAPLVAAGVGVLGFERPRSSTSARSSPSRRARRSSGRPGAAPTPPRRPRAGRSGRGAASPSSSAPARSRRRRRRPWRRARSASRGRAGRWRRTPRRSPGPARCCSRARWPPRWRPASRPPRRRRPSCVGSRARSARGRSRRSPPSRRSRPRRRRRRSARARCCWRSRWRRSPRWRPGCRCGSPPPWQRAWCCAARPRRRSRPRRRGSSSWTRGVCGGGEGGSGNVSSTARMRASARPSRSTSSVRTDAMTMRLR